MRGKIFCIGELKSATTSMGLALELLGFRHTGYSARLKKARAHASGGG